MSGWIFAALLGGFCLGVLLAAWATGDCDKEAAKQGVIRLQGKLYRLTPAEQPPSRDGVGK